MLESEIRKSAVHTLVAEFWASYIDVSSVIEGKWATVVARRGSFMI